MATLFFDIDGTLAFEGKLISHALEMLDELRERGHVVCICSGRGEPYVKALFKDHVDGIISNNGRYITYKGNCIFEKALRSSEMRKYYKIAKELGGMCTFTAPSTTYAYEIDEAYTSSLLQHAREHITKIREDDEVIAYSFAVLFKPPLHFDIMQKAFENEAILNNHFNNFSADASTLAFGKGEGIEVFLSLVGLDPSNTYAFGDGSNDVCMFHACTHGIAMGNAVDELKQCAEFISKDFQEQGVFTALKHYKLL